MIRTITALSSLAFLTACGDLTEGMSEGFEESVATEFAASCKTESESLGVPADLSEKACDCAAERAASDMSMTELMSGDTSKIDAIMEDCFNEIAGDGMTGDSGDAAPSDQPVEEN